MRPRAAALAIALTALAIFPGEGRVASCGGSLEQAMKTDVNEASTCVALLQHTLSTNKGASREPHERREQGAKAARVDRAPGGARVGAAAEGAPGWPDRQGPTPTSLAQEAAGLEAAIAAEARREEQDFHTIDAEEANMIDAARKAFEAHDEQLRSVQASRHLQQQTPMSAQMYGSPGAVMPPLSMYQDAAERWRQPQQPVPPSDVPGAWQEA